MSRTWGGAWDKPLAYFGTTLIISMLLGACRIERRSPSEKEEPSATSATSQAVQAINPLLKTEAPGRDTPFEEQSGAAGAPGEFEPESTNPEPEEPAAHRAQPIDVEGANPAGNDHEDPELSELSIPEGWELVVYGGGSFLSPEMKEFARKSVGQGDPTAIAAKIVARLETLPTTNAGPGSALRLDGETIEASAVVVDGTGRSAVVGGVRETLEPVMLAEALFRAGGGSIWGPAADKLAARFALRRGSLELPRARANYLSDLSHAAQSGLAQRLGTLFSLYVTPEALTESLTARPSRPMNSRSSRLPIFAFVVTPDKRSALAMSYGGEPLALPGSRSLIENVGSSFAIRDSHLVVIFPGEQLCSQSATNALERLRVTRSLALTAELLEVDCKDAHFLAFTAQGNKYNLEPSSVLQMSGKPQVKVVEVPLPRPAPVIRPPLPVTPELSP